jgi:hypothetical protein
MRVDKSECSEGFGGFMDVGGCFERWYTRGREGRKRLPVVVCNIH